MNDLIARKRPPACRDNGAGPAKRTMQPKLCAVSGVHPGKDSTVLATPDQLARDAAVEAQGGSAMPASPRGAQRRLPEADPNQAFASDPSLVVPVIASLEEVLLARELRQQLKKRYLDHPTQPCSLWCVGID
jgi:hypothetical protein